MDTMKNLLPSELNELLAKNQATIVDVREYPEFAGKRIPGSRHLPLSQLGQAHQVPAERDKLVLVCRSGRRSEQVREILKRRGIHASQLTGGIDAWEKAELPLESDAKAPWSIERQVRLIAGMLVLLGLALSHFWTPAIAIAWLVPAGLVFAAITDSCLMASVLSKLPWNRQGANCAVAP
jgi:rhodanese-related sulfurtransferase